MNFKATAIGSGFLPRFRLDGNIDVHVFLEDGAQFVATLYTPENLRELMNKWRATGEYSGDYVWDRSMVVVRDLRLETIRAVVADLIASGDLQRAFEPCLPDIPD